MFVRTMVQDIFKNQAFFVTSISLILQVWCTRWRTSQNQRAFSSLVPQRLAPVVQPACALPPSAPRLLHLQITQLLILAHQAFSTAWMIHWTSVHRGTYVTKLDQSVFIIIWITVQTLHWKVRLKTNFDNRYFKCIKYVVTIFIICVVHYPCISL